ncbi:MAG: relaxase/mobilization nuclease domain-containing protein [Rhodospirillales bacterium]|nr:relaxase/mobilization nuclease domain-containing protein [Rhodospirillales bacterium]
MIVEIIPEPKGAAGFGNLARYVVGAERGVDPAAWERLSSYVLGKQTARGEIVTDVRVTNTRHGADDVGLAVKEAMAANDRCIGSLAPKVYHFVISLQPGESLAPRQFEQAEQRIVDALGLGDCQRISVTHNSKEHLHRHVAIATASAPDMKNHRPRHDYAKVMAVAAELERELGLAPTNHERGTGRAHAASLQERAQTVADELVAAKTWDELHRVAAQHGLAIKPRGDGLVVGSLDNAKLHVRASRVRRELGKNRLEDRLGPYQPPGHGHERGQERPPAADGQARGREEPAADSTGPAKGALYDRYLAERAAATAARNLELAALRERQAAHTRALREFYADRMRQERALNGGARRARRRNVRCVGELRDAAHAQRIVEQRAAREKLKAAHPVEKWEDWLRARAGEGDVAALSALRSRETRAASLEDELRGADPARGRDVLLKHAKRSVQANGHVLYSFADGGLVVDTARTVKVRGETEAARRLALELARERFGRELRVHGSEEFKAAIACTAGRAGTDVRFVDAELERLRQNEQRRAMEREPGQQREAAVREAEPADEQAERAKAKKRAGQARGKDRGRGDDFVLER